MNYHLKPQLFPGVKYNVLHNTFANPVCKPTGWGLPSANLLWTSPCSSTFDASFADWGSKCRLRIFFVCICIFFILFFIFFYFLFIFYLFYFIFFLGGVHPLATVLPTEDWVQNVWGWSYGCHFRKELLYIFCSFLGSSAIPDTYIWSGVGVFKGDMQACTVYRTFLCVPFVSCVMI